MNTMLLLALAVVAGLLAGQRETKPLTRAQRCALVVVGLASCALGAGLVLGGYV